MPHPPEQPPTPSAPATPSQSPPPPGPEGASSWPEFTACLRELYGWSGTPKYRALCSRITGLSPAAVSTLIGKNPLSQPPETGTRRFVLGCLTYGGHPDPHAELVRWTDQWQRLATATERPSPAPAETAEPAAIQAAVAAPVPAPSLERSRRWRPGRLEVGIASSVLTATVMAIVGFTAQDAAPDPTKNCVYVRGTIPDSNLNISWSGFYQCPNRVSAAVYRERRFDVVIGYAETDPGRFMCWARGRRHWGGNDIWYYTKADKATDQSGWGFMPASDVQTESHPDPAVSRQCHFT